MKRATLLYNPLSGSRHSLRLKQVEEAAAVLRDAGVDAELVPTRAAGIAGEQAREAVANGSDTIFACGGDGTLHDVLQGIVGSEAALGVIPLGTANALAYDLGIPLDPANAASAQLAYQPCRIAAGTIEYASKDGTCEKRYFTVMSGAGPDAAMVYELSAGWKQHFGLFGYLLKAAQMFFTHHFSAFHAEFVDRETGKMRRVKTVSVMAVRITNFGNVLRKLAPGAALDRDDLRIIILKRPARLSFLMHILAALIGHRGRIPGIEFVSTGEVHCTSLPTNQKIVRAEADGEHLGDLPVRISIEPNAFTLLVPAERA